MKPHGTGSLLWRAACVAATLCSALAPASEAATKRPSVVVILADDLSWNDPGFAGGTAGTPALDALARAGVQFTRAYSAGPNCAPSRASLLTGQYPPRHGVYTVVDPRHDPGQLSHRILGAPSRAELPTENRTLAETLSGAGYRTAMFGMWNLGRGRTGPFTPTGRGFEVSAEPKTLGFEQDAYQRNDGAYLTDVLTDRALDWLKQVEDEPFFLYLAYHDVHEPFDPRPDQLERAKARGSASPERDATLAVLDENIGRVVAALKASGRLADTHIVFSSDNGGSRRFAAPLRGGKGTLYEGGIRVPLVWSGPGVPAHRKETTPVHGVDVVPTLLELCGIQSSNTVDGASLVPLFKSPAARLRRTLFWHFPCYMNNFAPASALMKGNLKLVQHFETGAVELFDLEADPEERRDLSSSRSGLTAELLRELQTWQRSIAAPLPTDPNPAYNSQSVSRKTARTRSSP